MAVLLQYVNLFFLFPLIQNLGEDKGCYLLGALLLHVFLELVLPAVCWLAPNFSVESGAAGIVLHQEPGGWHHSLKWVKTKVLVGFD